MDDSPNKERCDCQSRDKDQAKTKTCNAMQRRAALCMQGDAMQCNATQDRAMYAKQSNSKAIRSPKQRLTKTKRSPEQIEKPKSVQAIEVQSQNSSTKYSRCAEAATPAKEHGMWAPSRTRVCYKWDVGQQPRQQGTRSQAAQRAPNGI